MAQGKKITSQRPAKVKKGESAGECIRCGTCCEKGGPSFHHADTELIEQGIIDAKYLYTIRKGELAYDNIEQRFEPVSSDVIKIKGKNGSWRCVFFDDKESACTIYENRPAECRALKCWDTQEIEHMYAKKRLIRKDLIAKIEGLWDLIVDHQKRCNYENIQKLVSALETNKRDDAQKKLREIIQYDIEIRKLVVSKAGLDADMLDFLFGRPLTKTIENYGLKVIKKGEKIILTPALRKR
jgi:Fe-S-cluster containining protein